MRSFTSKKIKVEKSLGEKLKTAREEKHFGLYYIAKTLSIPSKYLEAIEKSQYSKLPSEIYAKNILKVYTNFLGIDFKTSYNQYKKELGAFQKTGQSEVENSIPPTKASRWNFLATPRLAKGLVIAIVLILSLTYLGVKIKAIFSPPFLIVTKPAQDLVIDEFLFEIEGQTEIEATLKINDRQVLPDDLGFFSDRVNLQEGINIIEIKAKKRYSREAVVERIIQVIE